MLDQRAQRGLGDAVAPVVVREVAGPPNAIEAGRQVVELRLLDRDLEALRCHGRDFQSPARVAPRANRRSERRRDVASCDAALAFAAKLATIDRQQLVTGWRGGR